MSLGGIRYPEQPVAVHRGIEQPPHGVPLFRLWHETWTRQPGVCVVGLLKSGRAVGRRLRWAAWLSFVLGIVVSLAANIAAAPALGWQPVLVSGWPPVALLLAVELLAQRSCRREITAAVGLVCLATDETRIETLPGKKFSAEPTAEQVMWNYFQAERVRGRVPTGAELDRVAGTNNYGRSVVRQWRESGRIEPASESQRNDQLFPSGQ